jgi:Zn-dependent protease
MENNYENQENYKKALKRVKKMKKFYSHLVTYIGCSLLFIAINLSSPGPIWFIWPILGWGIGMLFHANSVFNLFPFLGKNWEERKMQDFMNEEMENKSKWS